MPERFAGIGLQPSRAMPKSNSVVAISRLDGAQRYGEN